ncbi:MAG TPA: PaaX family transcriptional regulator C-terminal domain-containing protein [Solirubrobacteraceae bacterium]|nr:PaaX family transcriptional regulator C-terminal domain-containing protein [Solirubrobacteraceae bacterium]
MPAVADSARPRSLLMTFFGAFVRDLGGWIAVADLIGLMADLDLDEQAVRSAVSRLKRRGVVVPERRAGAAGYRLTRAALAMLEAGDARIFERPRPAPADRRDWLLVSFSIPEAQRALRHRLRARLEWLGLGTVASAVWIGPAHVEAEVRALVDEFGLAGRVELFRAEHAGFTPAPAALARWWDLDALGAEYRGYLDAWRPRLRRWRRRRAPAPAEAFADYVRQLDAWRRIPFHDPGLPPAALPADWPGTAAWALFAELGERLHGPALRHVTARVAPRARAA